MTSSVPQRGLKYLILKPSSLGDVVQALPVLRLLKREDPTREVHWMIDRSLAPLLDEDPDIARLHFFDRKGWSKLSGLPNFWRTVLQLRRERFDTVIDLQGLARSGSLAWLTNGRFTIGMQDSREGAPGFYDRSVPRPSYETHAVDWYLQVLRVLGVAVHDQLSWLPLKTRARQQVLERWNLESSRWIALQPGARWDNKRWPIEYFQELVRQLARQHPSHRFVVIGAPSEQSMAEKIVNVLPDRVLNLAGKTSLSEMIEVLRLCDMLVTNDTGPMHIAAALPIPLVGLFGPTDFRRTGPYRGSAQVLHSGISCAPCMRSWCSSARPLDCLRRLEPHLVAREVQQRLASV